MPSVACYFAGDAGARDDRTAVSPEEFRAKRQIDVRTGWEAIAIDPHSRLAAVWTAHEGEQRRLYEIDLGLLQLGELLCATQPGQ